MFALHSLEASLVLEHAGLPLPLPLPLPPLLAESVAIVHLQA